MKDKTVFKLHEMDFEKLAYSLGLANAPQVTVKSRQKAEAITEDGE